MNEPENNLPDLRELEKWYDRFQERKWGARLSVVGNNRVLMDLNRPGAANLYRDNWEGCRDLWKLSYRHKKELAVSRWSTK